MIKIEFLYSPDNEILREFEFFFDLIHLGNTSRSNLIINDKNVSSNHLQLYIKEEKLFSRSENNTYLVNGKKVSGEKNIEINDVLTIGSTEFKIITFRKTVIPLEKYLRDQYREIENNRPDITMLLDYFESELLNLQQLENKSSSQNN